MYSKVCSCKNYLCLSLSQKTDPCTCFAGRLLETSIAKPQTEKRAGSSTAMNASVGAGILPQQQSRAAFGLSRPDPYGAMTSGCGSSRGYGQVNVS